MESPIIGVVSGANAEKALEVCGSMSIKHPWFSGTRALMEYFIECVKHEKRARIVIDYDPQNENTKITFYQDVATQNHEEAL